eukprot:TRINITY_DN12064_c2_g3_i2.p1 TRINITY_DN12064_c2_g3~~TRINITY_DN12064_c2_g3_i2.p1  ORF type:complete len:241 (+),score=46.90 TRINITY_DN12064_c2_g3_i2:454-1176(+)
MPSKQKLKFKLELVVEQLLSVPYKTGVLFCKIKRKEGTLTTNRIRISNHAVSWNQRFEFPVKMFLSDSGVVQQQHLKVAVRREQQGSASPAKAGMALIDLSEYAGRSNVSRRYLLDPETKDSRQDNSVLKVIISLSLLEGPTLFKARSYREDYPEDDDGDLTQALDRLQVADSTGSLLQAGSRRSWSRSDAGAVVDEILRSAGTQTNGSLVSLPNTESEASIPTRTAHDGMPRSKSEGNS